MIVYYEHLINNMRFERTVRDICSFLDFGFNQDRFNCISKHPYTKFKRNPSCTKKVLTIENVSGANFDNLNLKNLFQAKHNVWINSAIDKISSAIERRGMNVGILPSYKNTVIRLNLC